MMADSNVKEPLIRISKKSGIPFWQAWLIRFAAIAIAFLLCAWLSKLLIGSDPLSFIRSVFDGAFGTPRRVWKLSKDTAVLLCISLAITPAFRMKFWNIGAEGQVLVGCLVSVMVIYYFGGKLPEGVLILLMLLASVLASAVWATVPATFKALWNTNETLFTLMMNYIATYLVAYFLIVWTPDGSSTLGVLKYGHLPIVFHNYFLIILIALILAISLFIYLYYSKHGYEISVVGESNRTAKYIGINVKKVIIRTMLLSGALCGIAGFLIVSGLDYSVTTHTVGGQGFTAIMVSWMAKFNPIYMIFTSLLVTMLGQGADQISTDYNIGSAFPDVFIGIVLFFIIGCEFFINYKIHFRSKHKEG